MGRLTIAEGKSLTSVALFYVWTIPVSSSGQFIRDIIHVTALDFKHYYDKFTSVMAPRKKSLSIVQRGYDHVLQISSCTLPVCIVSRQDSHHCFFFGGGINK